MQHPNPVPVPHSQPLLPLPSHSLKPGTRLDLDESLHDRLLAACPGPCRARCAGPVSRSPDAWSTAGVGDGAEKVALGGQPRGAPERQAVVNPSPSAPVRSSCRHVAVAPGAIFAVTVMPG